MMAKRGKATGAGDRIRGLPDELLLQVLSVLPARDAVRTCALSPPWSHLWPSARRLEIYYGHFAGGEAFVEFVNSLLSRRGAAPLDTLWLQAGGWRDISLDNLRGAADLWIRHALSP